MLTTNDLAILAGREIVAWMQKMRAQRAERLDQIDDADVWVLASAIAEQAANSPRSWGLVRSPNVEPGGIEQQLWAGRRWMREIGWPESWPGGSN